MKLTAESIVKSVPLMTGTAIVAGIVKALIYYNFFGLRIFPYLESGETLLMFFDDIILYFGLWAFCILLIELWLGTGAKANQEQDKLVTIKTRLSKINKGKKLVRILLIAAFIFSLSLSAFLWYKEGIYCAINTIIGLLGLSLVPAGITELVLYFWDKHEDQLIFIFTVAIIVLIILEMGVLGFFDANAERFLTKRKFNVELIDGSKIINSDSCLFIGRTKNYSIFYNPLNKFKRIIPNSAIKEETIK
jgi:hypothetical protein